MQRTHSLEPTSLGALSHELGVSRSQLDNWSHLDDDPLPTTRVGRRVLCRRVDVENFCRSHRHLPAARKALRRIDADAPSPPWRDPDSMLSVAASLRAAAASTLEAALSAVALAEATAAAHRTQVESLAATIRAFDDVLTQLTAPSTIDG